MNNKSCIDTKHQYGLWNIDKESNLVWRTCNKCGFKRELPITDEIIDEINKQEEASKIFRAFQLVDDNDNNLINYIELILDDYVNYLGKSDFNLFVKRIKKLDDLDILDAKTILFLNRLETYFVVDDIESINEDINNLGYYDEHNINIDYYEQG